MATMPTKQGSSGIKKVAKTPPVDLESETARLEAERAQFEKDKNLWAALTQKLAHVHFPKKVKLDVGGTIFATSIETLTKISDTVFWAMFSGRWETSLDEQGAYFIDRSPIVFDIILDFMRDYPHTTLDVTALTQAQKIALRRDADFFSIQPLVDLLYV